MQTLALPENFKAYLDATLVRFQYLYPEASISITGSDIQISAAQNVSNTDLKQEFLHLLYKEKIYAETLEIRKSLYQAITS